MAKDILVPHGVRDTVPGMIPSTKLGHTKGSIRQYRHGRLHIREYEDAYLVHTDKIDPRQDPLGHIIHDAPEVAAGLALGCVTGVGSARAVAKITGSSGTGVVAGILTGLVACGLTMALVERFGDG